MFGIPAQKGYIRTHITDSHQPSALWRHWRTSACLPHSLCFGLYHREMHLSILFWKIFSIYLFIWKCKSEKSRRKYSRSYLYSTWCQGRISLFKGNEKPRIYRYWWHHQHLSASRFFKFQNRGQGARKCRQSRVSSLLSHKAGISAYCAWRNISRQYVGSVLNAALRCGYDVCTTKNLIFLNIC